MSAPFTPRAERRKVTCEHCGQVATDPLHHARCAHHAAVLDHLVKGVCQGGSHIPEATVMHLFDQLLGLYGTDYQRAASTVHLMVDLGWRPVAA